MKFSNVYIEDIQILKAPETLSTRDLEQQLNHTYQRLGIPLGCIETLIGIKERRFWPKNVHLDTMATAVCEQIFNNKPQLKKEDIQILMSSSVSKEYLEPSVAALVHGDLKLSTHCSNFDLSNACLGFMSSMKLAAQLIESGQIQYALLVASESSRNVVTQTIQKLQKDDATMDDYKSFLPTLTLGSGAVAMLLCHKDVTTTTHRFTAYNEAARTEFNRICMGTHDWMRTDAQTLLKEGVTLAKQVWTKCQEQWQWKDENIDHYTVHQVGATHLATIGQSLDIDIQKAVRSYPEFGNMGSAAVPFTLKIGAEKQLFSKGQKIALMGIGSGLNCAMAEVIW